MPVNPKYLASFEACGFYHIYNRTNNKERLFLNDRHRNYFLRRFTEIVGPYVETFAWSLLSNHFHLLIRINPDQDIKRCIMGKLLKARTSSEEAFLAGTITTNDLMALTFKRFFQAYAQGHNKDVGRTGSMFAKPFKRVRITNNDHLIRAIIYIHANAVRHKITKDFTGYKWSSWNSIVQGIPFVTNNEAVLKLFNGKEHFVEMHRAQLARYINYRSGIEE